MILKPSGKVLRMLALVACATTIFTRTASALPGHDEEQQSADPAAVSVPSPDAAGTAGQADGADAPREVIQYGTNVHVLPFQIPSGLGSEPLSIDGLSPASGPDLGFMTAGSPGINRTNSHTLTYYGGPVISNVAVAKVNYGAGTYQSYVSGTGAGTMSAFFQGVTGSAYFTWLNGDYKTPTQTIGYGSYAGNYVITPSSANDGSTIKDTQIQAELIAQIKAGTVPAPTANTLYFVYFPKGKKITQGTSSSCVSGGFCAYHGTIGYSAAPGGYVYYAVMPDNSTGSGCDSGCGTSTPFNNWCSVSSHEMIEAVTDAAVGVATTYSSPLAWYNKTYGEIGDICNGQQGTVTGTDGVTYTVQKEWSNSKAACRTQ